MTVTEQIEAINTERIAIFAAEDLVKRIIECANYTLNQLEAKSAEDCVLLIAHDLKTLIQHATALHNSACKQYLAVRCIVRKAIWTAENMIDIMTVIPPKANYNSILYANELAQKELAPILATIRAIWQQDDEHLDGETLRNI